MRIPSLPSFIRSTASEATPPRPLRARAPSVAQADRLVDAAASDRALARRHEDAGQVVRGSKLW